MNIVLNSYGTSLLRKDNMLVIYKDKAKHAIDPKTVTSIIIYKGALISSDAILLAVENSIDIVFMDKLGKPRARMWSPKVGGVVTIRRNQLNFMFSPQAVKLIKNILKEKIDNQIALLLSFYPEDQKTARQFDTIINRLDDYKSKIDSVKGDIISEVAASIRGWEGAANRQYFSAFNLILPEEYQFKERSQHPARDVLNAMLNYAYGILYGKVEAALIRSGIDPYVGIMHREDYNRPVLTFDVIEKYRVWAEYVVLHLAMQRVINEDFYSIKEDGTYWLEQLGRRIIVQAMHDYLEDEVVVRNKKIKRIDMIQHYAKELASLFLHYKIKKL